MASMSISFMSSSLYFTFGCRAQASRDEKVGVQFEDATNLKNRSMFLLNCIDAIDRLGIGIGIGNK